MIVDSEARLLIQSALTEAKLAVEHGDVPIGAVIAQRHADGSMLIIASAHNRREVDGDPTAHAEVLALRSAAQALGRWRLEDCVLAVTLEPCAMCAGAAISARVASIVFGAADPKAGAVGSLYNLAVDPRLNHNCEVAPNIDADQCGALLTTFFAERRVN